MRDNVARYVRACRMAANESVRLYMLGGIDLDRLVALVRDVGSLERAVDQLTIGEREALNRQLRDKTELAIVLSNVMTLRNQSAVLKAISLTGASEPHPPPVLHMPPRDD